MPISPLSPSRPTNNKSVSKTLPSTPDQNATSRIGRKSYLPTYPCPASKRRGVPNVHHTSPPVRPWPCPAQGPGGRPSTTQTSHPRIACMTDVDAPAAHVPPTLDMPSGRPTSRRSAPSTSPMTDPRARLPPRKSNHRASSTSSTSNFSLHTTSARRHWPDTSHASRPLSPDPNFRISPRV